MPDTTPGGPILPPAARYIVFRPGAGLTPRDLGRLDGRWEIPSMIPYMRLGDRLREPGEAIARATDRYEIREDGERAQVWEVTAE